MPFLTPSDIALYLKTTLDTADQTRVQKLIDGVLIATESSLGYPLLSSERQAVFDGGQGRVWLPEPIVSIDFTAPITVGVYNALTNSYDTTLETYRLLADGSVVLRGLGYGPDAVQITYTAGWMESIEDEPGTFPNDLKQALVELVAAKWSVATAAAKGSTSDITDAPVKSISIGSLKQEFAVGSDTTGVTAKLQAQANAALDTIHRYQRGRVL